jgi:hypothetical protein
MMWPSRVGLEDVHFDPAGPVKDVLKRRCMAAVVFRE